MGLFVFDPLSVIDAFFNLQFLLSLQMYLAASSALILIGYCRRPNLSLAFYHHAIGIPSGLLGLLTFHYARWLVEQKMAVSLCGAYCQDFDLVYQAAAIAMGAHGMAYSTIRIFKGYEHFLFYRHLRAIDLGSAAPPPCPGRPGGPVTLGAPGTTPADAPS